MKKRAANSNSPNTKTVYLIISVIALLLIIGTLVYFRYPKIQFEPQAGYGYLNIKKVTVPADTKDVKDVFEFSVSEQGEATGKPEIFDSLSDGRSISLPDLNPGDYVITETPAEGWTTTSKCYGMEDGTNTIAVVLSAGITTECEFTNTKAYCGNNIKEDNEDCEYVDSVAVGCDDPAKPVCGEGCQCQAAEISTGGTTSSGDDGGGGGGGGGGEDEGYCGNNIKEDNEDCEYVDSVAVGCDDPNYPICGEGCKCQQKDCSCNKNKLGSKKFMGAVWDLLGPLEKALGFSGSYEKFVATVYPQFEEECNTGCSGLSCVKDSSGSCECESKTFTEGALKGIEQVNNQIIKLKNELIKLKEELKAAEKAKPKKEEEIQLLKRTINDLKKEIKELEEKLGKLQRLADLPKEQDISVCNCINPTSS